ncbi:aminopeptidase N [Massilia sp. PAMC28688]|uniref:aminopeptidase N n=1 Tax=Massilia sp. PAMC28688 TaxID=2861283 RepID=UPI001C63AE77|nr:aminopeptidase N [Massilia sp. PAMC28688]QYF95242.1 aminopeptidase N [Massilia sp. PAMC28688]
MKLLTPVVLTLALLVPALSGAAERAATPYLTQADAAARSARIANVDYVLSFVLTGQERFSGSTTLSFDLKDARQALTVDLSKANITALQVNGKRVVPRYNGHFITLAPAQLKKGRNVVMVDYDLAHSNNGEGMHRMVDPADGRVYTYSQFGPAAAQQAFASFDQPDLKATFTLAVTAPADWQVISTAPHRTVTATDKGMRWQFATTRKLSTYTVSLHAGPYKMWEDKSGKYPMRLFARQSVAAKVSPEIWFGYTRQGLAYFDKYYGVPYPFEKYDQLLVPDFLFGAMENTAAVTFAEKSYLSDGKMSGEQRHALAGVILHELAHQWFGDLVTMRWWNGVWLNEGFASFMGTLATAETTEFKNAWQRFYALNKTRAYAEDQQVGAHPVDVPVASSANAYDNLDAITYHKGASALMQLRRLLGDDVFRKGVNNYVAKYAWKNATLDDFIATLSAAAGRDLKPWARQWLRQPGVNTISADYSCAKGKVTQFQLRQAPGSMNDVLREQRVQVALLQREGERLVVARSVPVTYRGAATAVPALKGAACPDLVYPNYEDWGFARVKLDERSFATVGSQMQRIDDPFLRTMLWDSLWDSTRDAALPLNKFVDAVQTNMPQEQDESVLADVLRKAGRAGDYLARMNKDSDLQTLERFAWQSVVARAGERHLQSHWLDLYLNVAASKEGQARLEAFLAGRDQVPGLELNQGLRWKIVRRLNMLDAPGSAKLIDAELARDKSDSGEAAALAARVGRPDARIKASWVKLISDTDTTLSFARVRTAMTHLYPAAQGALNEQTAALRLEQLPALEKSGNPLYLRHYLGSMLPATCSEASVARLGKAIAGAQALSENTRKALRLAQQEDARCVALRQAMPAGH